MTRGGGGNRTSGWSKKAKVNHYSLAASANERTGQKRRVARGHADVRPLCGQKTIYERY
jgi:hypothetical protein